MRYISDSSDSPMFIDLGEFESADWNQWVDLYIMFRPIEYNNGSSYRYISIGARFSDDGGDYHSFSVRVGYRNNRPDYSALQQDNLVGAKAIDGVREAIERMLDLNIL